MAEINEFGEIIRNENTDNKMNHTIPTFTPPGRQAPNETASKKDKYQFQGKEYDLKVLEDLEMRLEEEVRNGRDDKKGTLTIVMQMLKKAYLGISKSSQGNPEVEGKLAEIQERQMRLQEEGLLLPKEEVVRSPQQSLEGFQREVAKQQLESRQPDGLDLEER